jgi:hypothetical protein
MRTRMKSRKLRLADIEQDLMVSTLKYSRLKGKLPEILAKDTASTIEVSSRVIVGPRLCSLFRC